MRVAVVLHERLIIRIARISCIERQMIVVIFQCPAEQTVRLRLTAYILDFIKRRTHIAERDVDFDLVIGNDQCAVVRDIVDGIGADRILTRNLIDGGRKILFHIAGILIRMDHAMLHAVLHKRPQRVFERFIVAYCQHIALRLGLCTRVMRGHKCIGGRNQPAAPAQGCQQQSKQAYYHPAFQSSPSLVL